MLFVNNGKISYDGYENYTFTPDNNFSGKVDISYNVIDEKDGSVAATQSFNIVAPSYSTIESEGDTTLVKDQDNYAYIQDAQNNYQAITYYDEHISLGMWEGLSLIHI